jgi:SAM-dependent methyltransferase
MTVDIRDHNRQAWDKLVGQRNRWTVPVSSDDIVRARSGDWQIVLTPSKAVPKSWFPDLRATATLCLASGGGQQGPLLAAAGAEVTVLDNSLRQLEQDRLVAKRDGLELKTLQGDMADLNMLADASFDLVVHPCSNCFVPDVRPVWRECFRVLRPGGILLSGFTNPVRYIFDQDGLDDGKLAVCHSIPYCDLESRHEAALPDQIAPMPEPLEFGHTLEDQIAGQLEAGFVITGFYEDRYDIGADALSQYLPTFIATRAVKEAVERL